MHSSPQAPEHTSHKDKPRHSGKKIRWGILSTAKIARTQVIPALQTSQFNQVDAICSRNLQQAQETGASLAIARRYGSYEELLADPEIDAIYNPLPNHLHVDWSIKALEAGKHVLCEKPIGLDAADTQRLLDAAEDHPQLKVMEAFMYRFHPQWREARQLLAQGKIGQVRHIHSHFAYNNHDQQNIRNIKSWGGGALMDVGCYCISLSRWLYGCEPTRVLGQITPYPGYEVDCLVSGLLEFPGANASFSASTKTDPRQYMEAHGEAGSLFLPIPFNPPSDSTTELFVTHNFERERILLESSNHYRLMGDAFARSILDDTPVPTPLSDALANMRIIDAIFASAESGTWISI